MKKSIILPFSLVLLASCGTKTVVVEKAPDTTAKVITTQPPVSPSENFLNGLTADYPSEVSMLGKADVLKMGQLTCDAIDEGSTLTDFVALANRNNVDAGFIGAMIREAVENFCPENQWFIDSALNA